MTLGEAMAEFAQYPPETELYVTTDTGQIAVTRIVAVYEGTTGAVIGDDGEVTFTPDLRAVACE